MPILDWKTMPNGQAKYQAYLASREWALLKNAVARRSAGFCENCSDVRGDQTHHQTYERIYREELSDLLHVCEACHQFLSGKSGTNPVEQGLHIDGDGRIHPNHLCLVTGNRHRTRRLVAVVRAVISRGGDSTIKKILFMEDHEGELTVTWGESPSIADRDLVLLIWEDGSIGDGGGPIVHQFIAPVGKLTAILSRGKRR